MNALLPLLVAVQFGGAEPRVDSLVAAFYARRGPAVAAWTAQGTALLEALRHAPRHGLDPARYGVAAIAAALASETDQMRRDSLLTRAFLGFAADLALGQVVPPLVDSLWTRTAEAPDLVAVLEAALDSGQVAAALEGLAPADPGYVALSATLARYVAAAQGGGWPQVDEGASPTTLRQRLAVEGYDTSAGLARALRSFQSAHGLVADGVVGPLTRAALNVPAAERAAQIALNLERWRWLPRPLGPRYIVVNSAAFTLTLMEHDTAALTMRVVAGRPDWPTPIVSSMVTALVFRPSWTVPRAIAVEELLPLLRRDPRYLVRRRIRVFGDSTLGGQPIDGLAVDWTAVSESTLHYHFIQGPGPGNPLGRVKLVLWTPFSVLLHDTPERGLFWQRSRAFSHGCVRLADAPALAAALLPAWPAESLAAALAGPERRVMVSPVPVHLVYRTAWVGDAGVVEFGDDVYGWDARLSAALAGSRLAGPGERSVGCERQD